MPWSSELSVHHEKLDRQHADLFRVLEQAAAVFEGGAKAALVQALDAFVHAMLEHTATEEALMEESLFPDRGRHRAAHEVFLADLQQLAAELHQNGPTPLVGEWLKIRVPEWLRFHVAVNDAKLGAHLAQRPGNGRSARRGDTRKTQS